jgi:hypothetical protein
MCNGLTPDAATTAGMMNVGAVPVTHPRGDSDNAGDV